MSFAAIHRFICWLLLASLTLFLAACGGGASSSTTSTPAGDTLTVSMALPDGTPANRFAAGTSANVTVVLLSGGDASKPIANARITFSTTATVATVALPSGQTLTDAKGKASTSLFGVAQGVDVLSVTAAYTDSKGTAQTVTGTLTYEVLQAVVAQPKITLSMDTGGNVTSGSQSILTAIVTNSAGQPVANKIVTFTNDNSYAVFNPESGTALTDASGVARMGLVGTSKLGADTITASVSVAGVGGVDTTATATLPYKVTASITGTTNPSLSLAMTVNGVGQTKLNPGDDGTVTAIFTDATGKPLSNALVTFALSSAAQNPLATLSATTALTDANGRALVNVLGESTSENGVVTISASATLGAFTASNTLQFTYQPPYPMIQSLVLSGGGTSVPALATVSVVATIYDAISGNAYPYPATVNFTSVCAQAGKATLIASAASIGGQATATYTDLGCGGPDTITASVTAFGQTRTKVLPIVVAKQVVVAAVPAALVYQDATPTVLGVKGSGNGEVSTIRFKLVDGAGAPVSGNTIVFSVSTTVGGIYLKNTSAVTDSNGIASAQLQSGSIGVPVIVTANLSGNAAISSQSQQLYISTKIPHQNGFSVAASSVNPEFYDWDGQSITLTVFASDRFGQPVPDGTAINFRTEGGVGTIQSTTTGQLGGCTTVGSSCSVTLTSAGSRSALGTDGRQTILAYAIGEDSFDDNNGTGNFSNGDSFPPVSNHLTYRQGGAFVNGNENCYTDLTGAKSDTFQCQNVAATSHLQLTGTAGTYYYLSDLRDSNEEYIDFHNLGIYEVPDGKYRGVGCTHPTLCSTQTTRLVFQNIVIVWSGSTPSFASLTAAKVTKADGTAFTGTIATANGSVSSITFPGTAGHGGCTDGQSALINLDLTDGRVGPTGKLNPLPANTTITVSTSNGTVDSSSTSYTVQNTTTAPTFPILVSSDATYSAGTCSNTVATGVMTVTVTTPKQVVNTYNITIRD